MSWNSLFHVVIGGGQHFQNPCQFNRQIVRHNPAIRQDQQFAEQLFLRLFSCQWFHGTSFKPASVAIPNARSTSASFNVRLSSLWRSECQPGQNPVRKLTLASGNSVTSHSAILLQQQSI